MRKIIILGLIAVFLISSAYGFDRPETDSNEELASITMPIAPGTGTQGECEPWETKNERCEGDIRHWDLCQKTASGGVWQVHSENCKDYGSNIVCSLGSCKKSEEASRTMFYIIGTIAIVFFAIFFWWKKR